MVSLKYGTPKFFRMPICAPTCITVAMTLIPQFLPFAVTVKHPSSKYPYGLACPIKLRNIRYTRVKLEVRILFRG